MSIALLHSVRRPVIRAGAPGLRWLLPGLLAVGLAVADAAPAAQPASGARPSMVVSGEKVDVLGFDTLAAFPYKIIDQGTGATKEEIELARKRSQIPAAVQAYDGARVALTGFMLPLKMVGGLAQSFVIMKDVNTCCYGATPNLNDYVIVTMKGAGIKPVQDVPVVILGTMRIAEKYENGYAVSLFEMEGTRFLGEKK